MDFNMSLPEVVWGRIRKLCVEEWLESVIKSMYENARSLARFSETFSD